MNYQDVQNLLPNATFLYANLTQEQVDSVTEQKYVSDFEGAKIMGTMEAIEGLTPMIAGSTSF